MVGCNERKMVEMVLEEKRWYYGGIRRELVTVWQNYELPIRAVQLSFLSNCLAHLDSVYVPYEYQTCHVLGLANHDFLIGVVDLILVI